MFAKDFTILPSVLSASEVQHIFHACTASAINTTTAGGDEAPALTFEQFLEALGRCAAEAFSRAPYAEERLTMVDKVSCDT